MNVEMERWPTMMGWEGGDEKKKQHGNSSAQRKIK